LKLGGRDNLANLAIHFVFQARTEREMRACRVSLLGDEARRLIRVAANVSEPIGLFTKAFRIVFQRHL